MNEIERRLCWHEVRSELYMGHLSDWPQGLPLVSIAWLERFRYSDVRKARKRYHSLVSLLNSEIAEGRLLERGPIVEFRKITSKREFQGFSTARGGAEVWENIPHIHMVNVGTILAQDLAPLLQGADLGKHLSAWLEPYWLEQAEAVSKWPPAKPKPAPAPTVPAVKGAGEASAGKPDTKVARDESPGEALERILAECERRASDVGVTFDVNDMPGQIAQFWDLCKRIEPVFKRQNSIDSFKRYTKAGRCKWSNSAKANLDATSLFRKLFPEAWPNGGAAAEKRRKA